MLLAIDIGNTNITLGAFRDNILSFTARLATDHLKTADQYAIEIKDILELYSLSYSDIEDCIISSVVPSVGDSISRAVAKLCDIFPLMLGPGVKTGLNIKIDNPAQLGADLVAGAVGAIDAYKMPCVIIDMGTASTVSVLDRNAVFLGGMIAAGVRLTLKALTENTSQLPSIPLEAPKAAIGSNTVECMQSGLIYGTAAMLDGEDKLREYAAKLRAIPALVGTAYNSGGKEKKKAELLIELLSDKFTFKAPVIAGDGLEFIDESGEKTAFTALSAGEIRLTEFYADLLFGTPDGALLLIDEPEISMHIAWQFALVDDVEEICRLLGGARAIIATHSPQILGGHRDIQVDLGEQYGE